MGNKKIKRGLSFLCILALTMSTLLGCQNALELKFNVKKGDKYKVVTTSEQKITEEISGQKINIDQTLKISYLYDITDMSSEGVATLNVKFDALSVKMNSGGQTFEYDSSKTKSGNDAQALGYEALVGQGFTAKIDKDGNVKEVSGVDKLFTAITDKMQSLDQNTRDSLVETLKQNFGDEALKESLGSMTQMYPENKKIKVGDSWESKQTITAGYPMTINSKYTMKENKGNIITLDVDSSIDAGNSSKPMELAGLKITYALKGTEKGTMKLTKSNGFIQSGEVNQSLTGTMEIEANAQIPNGMSVPMSMEAKTSYEVTKQ